MTTLTKEEHAVEKEQYGVGIIHHYNDTLVGEVVPMVSRGWGERLVSYANNPSIQWGHAALYIKRVGSKRWEPVSSRMPGGVETRTETG
ncbi:MAG TPA: hypothetical protein VJH95_02610 [Candidatus Nanoarchaeia archaeon]|nr:hypothetical protein [Candidatus Nanoarchaeia archaeon]